MPPASSTAQRTSVSHPLQIAAVCPAPGFGQIGLTFCPGKVQRDGLSGQWARDLEIDLDAIAEWGASAVLTLVQQQELVQLRVPSLGEAVQRRQMDWFHLPIVDGSVPNAQFAAQWLVVGPLLRQRLREGRSVLVHCKGGLGRAGLVAAQLLVELGWQPTAAIAVVRAARGEQAIETREQEGYVVGVTNIIQS